MIVSHEKCRELLADLRARGPATVAQLVERLAWSERLVRGALDVLSTAGEIDWECGDVAGRIETVYTAEPC